ncbi:MAG: hypothetical protein Q9188_003917 [Gyalolechia gomerana]
MPNWTMAPSRSKKKRHVSRPLSPTHKRRKSAPPIYDQTTGDPQQTVQQEAAQNPVPQRARRSTVTDHAPHLLHSGLQPLRIEDDVPSNQSFVNGVTPSQGSGGSSVSIRWPVASQAEAGTGLQRLLGFPHLISDLPSHDGPLPGAVFHMGTEAVHQPLTQIKPRKSAVQCEKGLVTRSQGQIAAEQNFTLNSRDSSLSSGFSASLSPLSLGLSHSDQTIPIILKSTGITSDSTNTLDSKVSDQASPSILRSLGIISDSTNTLDTKLSTNTPDSDLPCLSKRNFSYKRLASGCSQENRPFERSSCPSPSPPSHYKAGSPGVYAKSKKGVHPALDVPEPTSRILRLVSMEEAQSDQGRDSSPDVLRGDPIKMYDGEGPTDVDTEEKVSLASMERSGSTSRSSSRPSSSSSVKPDTQIVNSDTRILSKADNTRLSTFCDTMAGVEHQPSLFFEFWRDAYVRQFTAPEPLIVLPALTESGMTQGRNNNDEVDTEINGQNDPSNPSGPSVYLSLHQWRFPPRVTSCEVREEIPPPPQNTIAPTRNSSRQGTESGEHTTRQPMSRVSGMPAQVPGLDGDASSVDPSLEAGVYHHVRQVTSNTPEPALQPTEDEAGSSQSRQAGGARQYTEPSSSRQQKGKQKVRPPHLLGEQSGRPGQDAASIASQVMPPGLTYDEINKRIVERNLAEEAQERREAQREERERQRKQRNAEEAQTESIQEWIAVSTPPSRCESEGMTVEQEQQGSVIPPVVALPRYLRRHHLLVAGRTMEVSWGQGSIRARPMSRPLSSKIQPLLRLLQIPAPIASNCPAKIFGELLSSVAGYNQGTATDREPLSFFALVFIYSLTVRFGDYETSRLLPLNKHSGANAQVVLPLLNSKGPEIKR